VYRLLLRKICFLLVSVTVFSVSFFVLPLSAQASTSVLQNGITFTVDEDNVWPAMALGQL